MEVNVLNLRKEIEDLKKVENLSSIITNIWKFGYTFLKFFADFSDKNH